MHRGVCHGGYDLIEVDDGIAGLRVGGDIVRLTGAWWTGDDVQWDLAWLQVGWVEIDLGRSLVVMVGFLVA